MDSPNFELLSRSHHCSKTAKYSDLTIYSVHRALVCSRSEFFEAACRNPFKESETGVIDLTEDDPEAVEHMVNYFYHLDYLSKPLSRRSSQRSSRPSSPTSRPRKAKKLNLALIEDPLLATIAAANQATRDPLTPPAEQTHHFDSIDESAKLPLTPMEQEFQEDPFESVETEPETVEKAHLLTHAKVYAIAEK